MGNVHMSRIVALSQAVAEDTAIVDNYLQANGILSPSFDIDTSHDVMIPSHLPAFSAQERVIDNTRELHTLMKGPSKAIRSFGHLDSMILQAIHRLKIAQFIPVGGAVSFEDIASFTKIDIVIIRRLVRFAMTNFFFDEDPPGMIRHTSLSRRLAEDPNVQGAVSLLVNESYPGSTCVVESLMRNGNTDEPLQSGWALANHAQAPFYEELNSRLPARAKPVADAMDLLAQITPVDHLLISYPWADLDQATIVDVGGGRGPVSVALANRFPNLRCVVQDLEPVCQSGAAVLKHSLRDRVSFMPHNFFDQQPVKHADVYFFRYIFHDWPAAYGINILRAHIPAFKTGSRVIINEFAIPERGSVSDSAYKLNRSMDMSMLIYFNGQERELAEWKGFIEQVDPRLKYVQAYHPKFTGEERLNKTMAIVEAVWTG